jgi:hypothetical protein
MLGGYGGFKCEDGGKRGEGEVKSKKTDRNKKI